MNGQELGEEAAGRGKSRVVLEGKVVGDRPGEGEVGCREPVRGKWEDPPEMRSLELCLGLWGKEALHPDLPLPPDNDLLWAFRLPAASAPGRQF